MRPGERLPLHLQLFDRDPAKFVRVTVRAPGGQELPGSPALLPHVSGGYYAGGHQIQMPSESFAAAFYEVFEDAAFQVPSETHGEGFDRFDIDPNLDDSDALDVSMLDGDEVLDANTFVTSLDDALVAVLERMEGTTLQ